MADKNCPHKQACDCMDTCAGLCSAPTSPTDTDLDEFIRKARSGTPPLGNHWKIDTAHGMTTHDVKKLLRDFIAHGVAAPSLWKVRKESNEGMALSGTEAWGEVWSVIEDPGRGEAAEQWVGFFVSEAAANKVVEALGVSVPSTSIPAGSKP